MHREKETQIRDPKPSPSSLSASIEDHISSAGEADEGITMSVDHRITISVVLKNNQAQTSAAIANVHAVERSVNQGDASANPALLMIESNW